MPRGIIGRAMNEHERLAFGYRQKAVELRAMGLDFKDPVTHKTIEELAAGYDRLAAVQEQLARVDEAAGES